MSLNTSKIDSVFNKYSSNSTDIQAEGIQQLCNDLGIDIMDSVILVFSKHLKAETMGIYSKAEFVNGMQVLGCDSIDQLRAKLPALRSELSNVKSLKETYLFVFSFSKEPGVRSLSFDVAVQLWRILLSEQFPTIERWIEFLNCKDKKHDIAKDTWNMVYEFLQLIRTGGVAAYDPEGAWPVLIDEFVEFLAQ